MVSQQQPFGSLEQTHETQEAIAQFHHGIGETPIGNEATPGNQTLYDQQFAGLASSMQQIAQSKMLGSLHQPNSQQYIDTALTKKKTPFAKKKSL
jgi:hypothetical protein